MTRACAIGLCSLAAVAAACAASWARLIDSSFSFDADRAGSPPSGWKVEGTGQRSPLATWQVAADPTAPSAPNVLALSKTNHDSGDTFNLCWTDRVRFLDGTIEVAFKAVAGEEDQGGGPIWRVRDSTNYYICRANPLEGNFRVYYVKEGARKQLASVKVEVASGVWHRIKVEHAGTHITCWLDGTKHLEADDATFGEAGGVGLWTKADAVTSFDDLRIQDAAGAPQPGALAPSPDTATAAGSENRDAGPQ